MNATENALSREWNRRILRGVVVAAVTFGIIQYCAWARTNGFGLGMLSGADVAWMWHLGAAIALGLVVIDWKR